MLGVRKRTPNPSSAGASPSLAAWLSLPATVVHADERLAGKACRSVHLAYEAGVGVAFYNEVVLERSAAGTYFCVCGWDKGYFGIQELGDGKKLVIFSVWDSNQDDPKAVPEDRHIRALLHRMKRCRSDVSAARAAAANRFSIAIGKTGPPIGSLSRRSSTANVPSTRWRFRGPDDKEWKHLVTFSTITGGKNLSGYYAFIEDFKRDRVSATKARKAFYANAWVKTVRGEWTTVSRRVR